MTHSGNLKKYLLIIRLLHENKAKAPSLNIIKAHLQTHGFDNISARTLSRDFIGLDTEFGISIKYDAQKKGYKINNASDEDLSDFNHFLKLLELAERVEIISETLQSAAGISKCIVFEHNDFFKGSEHLKTLADAIQRKILINFNYNSYLKEQAEDYILVPYLIMENRNRWYLLGRDQKENKIKTFGLDRIQQIQLMEPILEDTVSFDYRKLFQHTFGITCLEEPPSRVVLSFTPQQGKYIKSLPLHHSQQILIDDADELRIELMVVLNIDLKMQILSYGNKVQVLEPPHLMQEVIEELKNSLKNYSGKTENGGGVVVD